MPKSVPSNLETSPCITCDQRHRKPKDEWTQIKGQEFDVEDGEQRDDGYNIQGADRHRINRSGDSGFGMDGVATTNGSSFTSLCRSGKDVLYATIPPPKLC